MDPARWGAAEQAVLRGLVSGQQLKSHRDVDGGKEYRLHDTATGQSAPVAVAVVERLRDAGLIVGNMKFPAATYLLTAAGEAAAATLTDKPLRPVRPRLFGR